MLDVLDFIDRKGGNAEKIRESQRRRYAPVEVIDEIIALWEDHQKTQYDATQKNSAINAIQKEIGLKRKAKENADNLMKKKVELEEEKKTLTDSAAEKETALKKKVNEVGNYIHDSVPVHNDEEHNPVIRTWTPEGVTIAKKDDILSHNDVTSRLDAFDQPRGTKIAGHRGYFLTGAGVDLNEALRLYALSFATQRGFTKIAPPLFMSKEYMAKTAQLEQFDEELYGVKDGDPQNDKYLIATSEQPISAYFANEWWQAKDLPVKFAGTSTCFRKEAGKHGKEALGLFRLHQFEKVEQFVVTDPEKSWEVFDEMIGNAEAFYKSLNVPYRVVEIVSGAYNNAAAKKYDLEAWYPFQGEYKELVSCSNCTDYQSRGLDARFGPKLQKDAGTAGGKKYVHMLNCTLTATERTLTCLLENFQTEEGFNVPEPLRKYIDGAPEFIPFTKELPKDSTTQKAKDKAGKADLPLR